MDFDFKHTLAEYFDTISAKSKAKITGKMPKCAEAVGAYVPNFAGTSGGN